LAKFDEGPLSQRAFRFAKKASRVSRRPMHNKRANRAGPAKDQNAQQLAPSW
jgi:hypothetical protein